MNVVTVTYNDPIYGGDQDYTYINGERFTGLLKIEDDNGILIEETQFKEGRVNDYDREYYNSGLLKEEIVQYDDNIGKLESVKMWDMNGVLFYFEKSIHSGNNVYSKEIVVDNKP